MHWPTYIVLMSGVLINSIWSTALIVPYSINRHGHIATYYAIVYGAAAFGFGLVGAASSGLIGVALVLLMVEASMIVMILNTSLHIAGVTISQWAKALLYPPFGFICQVVLAKRNREKVV